MKPTSRSTILVATSLLFPSAAFMAVVTKADNTSNLNLSAAWVGGVAPGSLDVADWSGTYNTAASLSATFTASTPVVWSGLSLGNITGTSAGLVSVGGTVAAVTGSSVTIGSSGIDMSAANQNLVVNSATTVLTGATQTWNIATGRNLRFGASGTGGGNANLDGSDGTVITVTGGGLVDANQGGVTGFADAAGFAGFNGKWVVNPNTTLRGERNGSTAWGTNTSADTITLNGGTLATGGITGFVGNWTWNSNITVSAASTIDNQNASGSGRYLKLNGNLTGSGNLTFASTGAATMSSDTGFIITNTNNLTGTVTLNSGVFVRVGGINGTDTTTSVGSTGDFGTASVVNNGTLTLSRNNTWTFANQVSGTGVLRVGVTTGSSTHIVTVTGNNSHSGGTTLQSAVTLNVGHANALGTGPLTIAGNGLLDNLTGSPVTVPGGLVLSGGSPTFNGVGDFAFNGPVTVSGANRSLTVNSGSLTLNGAISQDASARNLTKAGLGNLFLAGTNNLTGAIVASAGTLTVTGSSATSAAQITGGTLVLDYGASDVSKLGDTATLTLGNGTLILAGATGSHTEVVGSTVLSGSTTLLRSGANSAKIAFGAITRNAGATLSIPGENFATTTTANVNGILPGITIGGTSLAANDGLGNIVIATSGMTEVTRLESGSKSISNNAASNIRVVDGTGSTPADITLADSGTTDISNLLNGATGGPSVVDIGVGNTLRLGAFAFVSSEAGSSDFTVTNGTLTAGGAVNTAGDIILANAGSSATTVSSVIANNGTGVVSVVKNGAGPFTLSGVNSFTGNVAVNAGTLAVSGGAAIADAATVTVANTAGAVFQLNASETIGNLTGGGTSGGTVAVGPHTLTVTIPSGVRVLGAAITGTGSIVKGGTGEFTLEGVNTFSGTYTVTSNSIAFRGIDSENGSPGVDLGAAGTLALGSGFVGQTATISSLSGSGIVTAQFDATTGTKTLGVNQATDTVFSGILRNNIDSSARLLALAKSGAGSLSLTGSNSHSGGTTVSAGTLVAASTTALGTGAATVTGGTLSLATGISLANAITVNGGSLDLASGTATGTVSIGASGTLTGSGTISGSTTLAGTLSPGGAGLGLVTLGAVTIAPTASIALKIDDATSRGVEYDALDFTGTLALDGTVTVTLGSLLPVAGQQFDLINSTGAIDLTNFNLATDLVLPVLAPNLLWNTSSFASNGVISIEQASLGTSASASSFAEDVASPASVVTVSVPVAPLTDLVVSITPTANGSEVSVPASVTILAGQTSATFNVSAVNDGVADGDKVVSFSLTSAGYTSGSLNLTVTDVGVSNPYVGWQNTKFTAGELANPLISGDNADPDGDGLSNALEYAFGTEPKNGDTGQFLPQASTASGALVLGYLRPVGGVSGVTYTIQSHTDLVPGGSGWTPATPVTDYLETTSTAGVPPGYEKVTITFNTAVPAGQKRFGRIFVSFGAIP